MGGRPRVPLGPRPRVRAADPEARRRVPPQTAIDRRAAMTGANEEIVEIVEIEATDRSAPLARR